MLRGSNLLSQVRVHSPVGSPYLFGALPPVVCRDVANVADIAATPVGGTSRTGLRCHLSRGLEAEVRARDPRQGRPSGVRRLPSRRLCRLSTVTWLESVGSCPPSPASASKPPLRVKTRGRRAHCRYRLRTTTLSPPNVFTLVTPPGVSNPNQTPRQTALNLSLTATNSCHESFSGAHPRWIHPLDCP